MTTDDLARAIDPAAVLAHLTGRARTKVGKLAAALGADLPEVELHLADLVDAGMAEVAGPDGAGPADLMASLSPLAASRLGLKLDAQSRHWIAAERPDLLPRTRPMRGVVLEVDVSPEGMAGLLDTLPDPDAAEALALAVAIEGGEARTPTRKPRSDSTWEYVPSLPRHFLGVDVAWPPLPRAGLPPGTCPVCECRPLAATTACLWCLRSGQDRWTGWKPPVPRAAVEAKEKAAKPGKTGRTGKALAGGTGAAAPARDAWIAAEAGRARSPRRDVPSAIGDRMAKAVKGAG